MSRILTIWLPRWPVQRRFLDRPELRRRPVFVCRRERRGVMTVVAWAWAVPPALQAGRGVPVKITEGMTLAEAMAVLAIGYGSRACHVAEIEHDDPQGDRLVLEELARSCRRFAPIVAIEAPPHRRRSGPECLHIDVTGTACFFGGEAMLVRTVVWTLAARGLHARAAIADTPAASWAAAHHTDTVADTLPMESRPDGRCWTESTIRRAGRAAILPGSRGSLQNHRRFAIVPSGEASSCLARLPASALQLSDAVMTRLRDVGVETIGDIVRLPRKGLASRFGPEVSQRLAEFTGARNEPLAVPCSGELPHAVQTFEFPLPLGDTTLDELLPMVERLLETCMAPLAAAGKGVTALQVRFERSRAADVLEPRPPIVIDIAVFRPSSSVRHMAELVRLRLARLQLPEEIGCIAVDVVSAAAAECRQRTLFGAATEASDTQVGRLLDRLAGRLGRGAVFEPRLVADAQPEHAWVAVPPGTDRGKSPPSSATRPMTAGSAVTSRRPTWLLPRPMRLETVAVLMNTEFGVTGGPPARFRLASRTYQVVAYQGPERIETAWWRGPMVRRDYYVVETSRGGRFWIFRRLTPAGHCGGWFLHGMFA